MAWLSKIIFSLVTIYVTYIYSVVSFETKHNVIHGMKFICGTHAPELANVTCKFKRLNRTTEFWSFNGYYAPKLYLDDFYINVTTYSRNSNLEWRPHMIVNYILDVCKYFNGNLTNKLIDILAANLKKSSNFMHPCPHYGNFYLRNMSLNPETFPQIIPSADIYIDFQYYMRHNGKLRKTLYFRPYLEIKTRGIIYF